ncbi:hypothetical protein [Hydrogenophaga sp.]|uniref:hypothetical protein n=1 Tax=Hydrogenophaga sp. TaxID=1904254 RepID=UPI002715618C|nr:hypothetical protein [Hydrogenophaga sp.]MDO9434712.1 hypothetical protein [Hydrogenophaga sp.]
MFGPNSSRGAPPRFFQDELEARRTRGRLEDGPIPPAKKPAYIRSSAANRLLGALACGRLPPAAEVRAIFSALILNGNIGDFLDVFDAYNNMCRKQWDFSHESTEPFQTMLTLQFPADWAPPDELEFLVALGEIRVDVLKVEVHADASEASESAFRCVARLLAQGGVTELFLGVPLALPSEVVHAIQIGGVRSIELSHAPVPASEQDLKNYAALATCLAKCDALEKLSLQLQPALLAELGVCFDAVGCPPL